MTEEFGYFQLQAPGVPYSVIRVSLEGHRDADKITIDYAVEMAELAATAYAQRFPEPQQEAPQRAQGAQRASAPAPARTAAARPAARTQRAQSNKLDPELIVEGDCPEHGCAAVPSILKYQETEFSEEGVERYAKYFCPGDKNGTGQNHPLWARELVAAGPF